MGAVVGEVHESLVANEAGEVAAVVPLTLRPGLEGQRPRGRRRCERINSYNMPYVYRNFKTYLGSVPYEYLPTLQERKNLEILEKCLG